MKSTPNKNAKPPQKYVPKLNIPDNQIHKAHILDSEGKLSAIIVFSRGDTDIPVMYKGIDVNNIYFSDFQIHLDDSIRVIKKKILFEMWNPANALPKCSYEELYIFGKTKIEDNSETPSRKQRTRYISIGNSNSEKNAGREAVGVFVDQPSNDDGVSDENIESINPYLTENIPKKTPKPVLFENRLLLNYEPLHENDIYVCLAENVLDFFNQRSGEDATKYAIHSYFPLLREKSVNTQTELFEKKPALLKQTKTLLDKNTEQLYRTVQLFYDVYNSTTRNTNYIRKGIQSIHFRIDSSRVKHETKKVLPLDSIFKLIHCSKNIPFIKYNPGNRRENLYRLYYEKMTPDGKKIPVLSAKQILKLSRETGRSNQISLYLHSSPPVFVNFEQNGDISVQCVLSKPRTRTELDDFFRESLNSVLSNLNMQFRQTGYKISLFHSLSDTNVRILAMKYVASVNIERDVQIDKIQCIYSLLTVNKIRNVDEPVVRYKRVENYKEMDAETALITELYNTMRYTEMTGGEMVDIIAQRFGLSEEQAKARVVECLSSTHEYEGAIIEHPGFPMKIQIANLDYVLEFEVESIDSVRYIEPLEVYIESILKMTQEIKPRSDLGNYIRGVCSNSKQTVEADKSHVENIVVPGVSAPGVIQPFALTNAEDIDIFQELGLTDEYEEDVDEEDIFTIDEETDDSELKHLYEDLYKNAESGEMVLPEEKPAPPSIGKALEEKPAIIEEPAPPSIGKELEEKPDVFSTITTSISGLFGETAKPEVKEKTIVSTTPEEPAPSPESESESDDDNAVFFESDDESPTPEGGAPKKNGKTVQPVVINTEDTRIRPDGLSLNHPNPFLRRMQSREPSLFLTKPQGKKYKSYSASCQPTSRQPVILTDAEKERIDREFPGSYKNAVKYGTDPKNPYWYICPRYWCFLTNSSISEEDVKLGKCGTIIPENADTIPAGAYVYEFKGDEHTDVKGNYIEHHPGFLKEGKHPDGYCLPCCFKNWDKAGQGRRREQCAQQTDNAMKPTQSNVETIAQTKQPPKSALYVISLDTYPVPHTRWGFAPLSIQLFFHIDYQNVVDKNNSAIITPNTPTFLRYGVEQSEHQSFLGVFADIYAYQQRQLHIPSIAEFKQILLKNITLDVFVRAHNSSLISVFRPTRAKDVDNIAKYMTTDFAKRLDMKNPEQMLFLQDTIASYENFIEYITHPTEPIDHTYLWDIFTSDIAGLNRGGVNLVLLEIMENDITDNIQLVCPTNAYSSYSYDSRKDTVFVLKHDNIYEPIYLYEFVKKEPQTGITSQRTFGEKTIHKNIKQLLTNIRKTSSKYCTPLPSLPRVYEFSEPITLDVLVEQIHKRDYIPISQVANYRNKVIGILVQTDIHDKSSMVMLPCFPSAPSMRFKHPVPIKTMDDDTVWKDYITTRDTLIRVFRESEHKIPCLPKLKVMEDELVVGIITATNQFVQIIPPLSEQIDDGIPIHRSTNPVVADNSITTTHSNDTERMETMSRIRLENQFYVAFRSTIRELLNDYIYREKRITILRILESKTHLYNAKLAQLEKELRTLVSDKIVFVDIEMDVLMELNDITECDSDAPENPYCIMKENGVSQLSIPKTNLLSKTQDNESMYYIRMADELLRNNRVKLFMFEPETYFNLVDITYKINAGEFIMSQTALQGDYFQEMTVFNNTNYIKNTNYDTAIPSDSQVYANSEISIREQYTEPIADEQSIECIDSIIEIVGSARSLWKRSFPNTAREVVYKNTIACSFFILITILKAHTNITHTVLQIKEKLWEGYSRILELNPEYLVKILGILRRQGKKSLMEPVVKRTMTLDALIFSEDYYVSDMDIWVIAQTLKLPIILFSPNGLKGFALKIDWLKCGGGTHSKHYFIRSMIRADKPNGISNYHLLQPTFALSDLREFSEIINDALEGNAEHARSIQSIETTLDKMELIAKPI